MNNTTKEELQNLLEQMTWLEAIDKIWLVQLADLVPQEIHLTIIDLVNVCKGLLETSLALQDVLKKVYICDDENSSINHKIAVHKAEGLISSNEALLLDKLFNDELFELFTKPMSNAIN